MTSPAVVLRAFGIGAPLEPARGAGASTPRGRRSAASATSFGFARRPAADARPARRGASRAPSRRGADETARLAPAFGEYRLLALSALAYYVSIWADKIVVYLVMGGDAAAFYAAIAAVAWFSVIPAFAWIYVQVETVFYQRFRAFYDDLESGAPLRQLQGRRRADLRRGPAHPARRRRSCRRPRAASPSPPRRSWSTRSGLSPDATPLFRLAAVGAAMQVITLLEVLLLYYFDLRRDALVISTAPAQRRGRAHPRLSARSAGRR